jgi:hypothetical protein
MLSRPVEVLVFRGVPEGRESMAPNNTLGSYSWTVAKRISFFTG